ncbi:MAG TPA: phytanoyl-CoA dioxygenase family protein [Planktothrix sp.]|jgi:hypothetical protein
MLSNKLRRVRNMVSTSLMQVKSPPARPITNFQSHNSTLFHQGFTTFSFLNSSELDALNKIVHSLNNSVSWDDVHIRTPFRLSAFHNCSSYKSALYEAIYAHLREKLDQLLNNYTPLVINVFEKDPQLSDSAVAIHQNPSFVEEPDFKSVSVWIPLIDVCKYNGTVGVLRGSQDAFDAVRAANMPDIFADVADQLVRTYFEPLNLRRGYAALLDDSAVHWSYPNMSQEARGAVQLIMVPREARHIYYYYNTDGHAPMVDIYDVSREFFFNFNCKQEPSGLSYISSKPFVYKNLTEGDLVERVFPKNPSILLKYQQSKMSSMVSPVDSLASGSVSQ